MKGTSYGNYIAARFRDRLNQLNDPETMPKHSHWEPDHTAWICRECLPSRIKQDLPLIEVKAPWDERPNCPECKEPMEHNNRAGETVQDGRYFYGLTYHDPTYDPRNAVIPKRDFGGNSTGEPKETWTVREAEKAGVSMGLDRYQQFYRASSKIPTERHCVPLIDGACGMSSVETIAKAVGITLEFLKGGKNNSTYILHDSREADQGS